MIFSHQRVDKTHNRQYNTNIGKHNTNTGTTKLMDADPGEKYTICKWLYCTFTGRVVVRRC